jgi:hypothetical protein
MAVSSSGLPRRRLSCDNHWSCKSSCAKRAVSQLTIQQGESSKNLRAAWHDPTNPSSKHSVIVKLASDKDESRRHGIEARAYEREINFYQTFGNKYAGVPRVYLAFQDESGLFVICMEDFPDAKQIDNLVGADLQTAKDCLTALARVQGPTLGEWMGAGQKKWLNEPNLYNATFYRQIYPKYLEKFSSYMNENQNELTGFIREHGVAWEKAVVPPLGLQHGDFRLDNILFAGGKTIIIDWATVSWAPFMRDFAYFMGTSLTNDIRRKHNEELFEHYMSELEANSEIKVERDTAWRAYVRETLYPVVCLLPIRP